MRRLTIHGCRGSYPVSGQQYARYGGNTSCFSLETDQGLLIIDAGTGLVSLGQELARRTTMPPMTLLFTHFHLDHLIGLPGFQPFRRKDAIVTLMADARQARSWRRTLKTITAKPFWPFGLLNAGATVRLKDLPGDHRSEGGIQGPITLYGIQVFWCRVWHPQGCAGYRFESGGKVLVLGTDREHGNRKLDRVFQELCRGADVLIYDAQYTPEEYPERSGWGHSTWEQGASLAASIGATQLVLTSHDPSRTDADIDRLLEQARRVFPNTIAASERLVVE